MKQPLQFIFTISGDLEETTASFLRKKLQKPKKRFKIKTKVR